jgi:hypothetical protein
MRDVLSTLRRKLLGETRSIPLGVGGALMLALLIRALLPHGDWQVIGGFTLAAAVIATLICSLRYHHSRPSKRWKTTTHMKQTTTRTQR